MRARDARRRRRRHVDVAERRELLRERLVVFFFLGMESQVLEQHDVAPAPPRDAAFTASDAAGPMQSSANATSS